ncbi:MAG: TetR/AcrR family transcriptional regulator [Burkholderiaceae bacterium]|nr:TetR/AcrR family transcriptional regulator [Burkholderiaceae bacterium]
MKKRDAKRQAILDTAYRLFQAQGFDQTSVSEITAQVGGSKATIYSHFPSKEELFVECMMAATEDYILSIIPSLETAEADPEVALRDYGRRFLGYVCSPDIVAVQRLLIAEANRFGIGKLFYDKVTAMRAHVSALLSRFMASGTLRSDDPQVAAEYLRAMLEAEYLEQLLFCARETALSEDEIAAASERAISTFLRAYAPAASVAETH